MSEYTVARLEEIEEISDGRVPWRPLRHHLGISSFGVNSFTGREAGDRLINEHDESDDESEELYVVLQGRAVFELDGQRVDAPTGTLVYARPEVKRTAFAEEPGTTLLALGGVAGKAYEVHGGELWAPLRPLYEAGEHAEAAERLRGVVEANPQYADLFYNLACMESLAGQRAEALEHLRRSIEMSPERFREFAKGDSDLDAIRDEPGFAELVGA